MPFNISDIKECDSQLLKLLTQNLPDMLWIKDLEGKYIYANKAICDGLLMAKDIEEPIGKGDIFFALREREAHKDKPDWHTFGEVCSNSDHVVIANNMPMKFEEYGNVKGKLLYLEVNKAPFYDKDGNIIGTVGSGRDITELKMIQIKLEEQYQLLQTQASHVSMGEMIGNIAHQWRQPLSVISTAATGMQLQKEYGHLNDKEFDKSCEAINKNAQYLSKTIDDFRNFIKGDRLKTIFKLTHEIDSFYHLVEGTIKSNHINMILTIDENIEVDGYENELTQCMINIFNNAKDALIGNLEDNRLMFISSSVKNSETSQERGQNVVIKIKDNAGGIPKDILPKIFEPYFTTKHQSQGTGLGLHMTYNLIVNGMNGTIEAHNVSYNYDNQKYTGAEFIITLPLS
ncbi:MAG: PAS domain-containing sensor histidine kinase [Arcobacteraceae bacterium]|nr:PAS domain-containing sensor histidine kinase [Arcobacteraceae bacterium]